MKCPNCSGKLRKVWKTRNKSDFISRQRICSECGIKVLTQERVICGHVKQ